MNYLNSENIALNSETKQMRLVNLRRYRIVSFRQSLSAEELLTSMKKGVIICLLTSIVSLIVAQLIVSFSEKNAFEMHEVEFTIRPLYKIFPKDELAAAVDNSDLGKITISQIEDKKIARVGPLKFIIWHHDVPSAKTMFNRLLTSSEAQIRDSLEFKYSEMIRSTESILSSYNLAPSLEFATMFIDKSEHLRLHWVKEQHPFYDVIFTSKKVEKLNMTPFIYVAAVLLGLVSGIAITMVGACLSMERKGHQS